MLTYMINKLAKSSITYEGVRRVIDKSGAKGVATSLLGSDKRHPMVTAIAEIIAQIVLKKQKKWII